MNPRLLLLEDDPVSAAFLRQALEAKVCTVDHAATLSQARGLVGPAHALWLFDVRLPDGDGGDLLAELRGRGLRTPALALTAADEPRELSRLRRAGFVEVLAKPIAAAALWAVLQRHLPGQAAGTTWDDDAALSALGGDLRSVQAMRKLFLAELADQSARLRQAIAAGDAGTAGELLHRLKASCGFVGALGLLESVQALAREPFDAAALARFDSRADALLAQGTRVSPA